MNPFIALPLSFFRSGNSDILDQMLEHQGLGTEDHEDSKDEVALMNNQVGGEKAILLFGCSSTFIVL